MLWEGRRGISGLTDNYLRVRLELSEIVNSSNSDDDDLIEDIRFNRLDGLQLVGSSDY